MRIFNSNSVEETHRIGERLGSVLKSGDVVIGLGAGTINALGKELIKLSEEVVDIAR